ncbi:MAG: hypothetical protein KDA78_16355, partial [Planctomycetaceae bacterium]|nr:hypothetical protein [Planctomycetaceae bacterium]
MLSYPPKAGDKFSSTNAETYQIVRLISNGAFGYVFEAIAQSTKQVVVIKIPHIDFKNYSEEQIRERIGMVLASFENEINASQRLDDLEFIAKSFDCGLPRFHQGQNGATREFLLPFIVQKHVVGQTLTSWCAAINPGETTFVGLSSVSEWMRIASTLLETVSKMHERRYAHLDIWPDNLLISDSGLYLIDFGMSFDVASKLRLDSDFNQLHPWLPPERLR